MKSKESFIAHYTNEELEEFSQLFKNHINEQIAKVMTKDPRYKNWTLVQLSYWPNATHEWCVKYLKHQYVCFGNYWYFEDEKDANFFLLRWSSI